MQSIAQQSQYLQPLGACIDTQCYAASFHHVYNIIWSVLQQLLPARIVRMFALFPCDRLSLNHTQYYMLWLPIRHYVVTKEVQVRRRSTGRIMGIARSSK